MTQYTKATLEGPVPMTADEITEFLQSQTPVQPTPEQRWESIKSLRDSKVQNGGYKVNDKWFHSDTFSRTQQLALVMMSSSLPTGIQWKTMDSSFIEMTPSLAQAVFSAGAVQDNLLFKHSETLKANPELDITTGWPETYLGV